MVERASKVREREALTGVGREAEKLVVNKTIGRSPTEAPFKKQQQHMWRKPRLLVCEACRGD